jgi:riboflavin synthase
VFTGLVEAAVPVLSFTPRGTGARLVVAPPGLGAESTPREAEGAFRPAVGDSIAVSGCCLTVVAGDGGPGLHFDLSAETLERTWFARLAPGDTVNLERALRLGDRLDGHMVSGHVDAVGTIVALADAGDGGWRLTCEVPPGFERWLVDKGSVTIDGISLTVVRPTGRRFDVAVIPHTFAVTSLGRSAPGRPINLEADLVGKWIERLMPR